MSPLHPPPAVAAAPHRDIETAHNGSPHNLFLILGFAAFRLHAAAAMLAALRQRNRDSFIDARRGGAAGLPAVVAAGFAAWALRVGLGCAARMWLRLTLAGTQRRFQFPTQTLRFLLQTLDLFAQPLVFLLRPVQLPFRNELDAFRWLVCGGSANWFHPTLR